MMGLALGLAAGFLPTPKRTPAAQAGFRVVTGKPLDAALPRDFYLEGNAIPTEKRNAVLLETSGNSRVVIALIDTTGYSSQVQKKYIGMLISEDRITVCGNPLGVGSYGFGLDAPPEPSPAAATFRLYDQAGREVFSCKAGKDLIIEHPRPLEVIPGPGAGARLYLGRYALGLGAGERRTGGE